MLLFLGFDYGVVQAEGEGIVPKVDGEEDGHTNHPTHSNQQKTPVKDSQPNHIFVMSHIEVVQEEGGYEENQSWGEGRSGVENEF